MKKDPENASHLKFWVSAYNYDQAGMAYDGREWATQFETGLINYKSEDEIIASVHNLYTDVYGGTYMQSAYRDGGTSWVGDQSLEQAKAKAKAKVTKALAWANKTATLAAKTRGWDKKRMMWNFQNPDKNWGIWPEILRMNGLDPAQYNIALMGKVLEQSPKLNAGYLNSEDVLRALDLEKFIVDPKLAQQFETETPFKNDIAKGRKQHKDDIVNADHHLGLAGAVVRHRLAATHRHRHPRLAEDRPRAA